MQNTHKRFLKNEGYAAKFYFRKYIGLISILTIFAYFFYQMMTGDRGFLSLLELSKKYQTLKSDLTTLEVKKQDLTKKVNMLKPESLNLDLLDEQVRRKLGYSKEGETLFIEKAD